MLAKLADMTNIKMCSYPTDSLKSRREWRGTDTPVCKAFLAICSSFGWVGSYAAACRAAKAFFTKACAKLRQNFLSGRLVCSSSMQPTARM